MSAQFQIIRNSPDCNPDSVIGKALLSGNYVAGGDTLSLSPSSFSDPNGVGITTSNQTPSVPPEVTVSNAGGYYAQFILGTTIFNGKLQWFAPGGAEVAAGAYPAAILGAYVEMRLLHRN